MTPEQLVLLAGLAVAVLVLGALLWRGAGRRSRLEQELAVTRSTAERVPALEEKVEALRRAANEKSEAAAAARARVEEAEEGAVELRERNVELERELRAVAEKLARVSTELEEREGAWKEKREELEGLHESLRDQFEALAGRLLEEKGERFEKQHTESLTRLLQPFREQLEGFRKEFGDAHEKERIAQAEMKAHLEQLRTLNENLAEEASALTKALTGQSKVRGDWGEMITEQLLQRAGLLEDRHYRRQESGTTSDGKRLQPDFVIELPNRRHVVVDSKVALAAYHELHGTDDPEEQERLLDAHCAALRKHVNDLGAKDYPSLYGFEALETVIMCVPTDGALVDALRHDAGLPAYAQERKVTLASPSLLQPILIVISQMWKIDDQHQNAQEMARRVGLLVDKLSGGLEAFEEVGDQLDRARRAFDTARNRLYTGHGNVLRQRQLLLELGAPAKKELPGDLEDVARLEAEAATDDDASEGNREDEPSSVGVGEERG